MSQDLPGPIQFEDATEDHGTHSEDGVDLTLIRWMLSLTPTERLETLQQNLCSIMRLRGEEEVDYGCWIWRR